MKIKRENLLLIAGIVWLFAGFNVLKIGLPVYENYVNILNIALSVVVFYIFWFKIFGRLVQKHTKRILEEEPQLVEFYKFFDKKSYIIMIFMMSFGIIVRKFNLAPDAFIAVFYSGLGSALFLAGAAFVYQYMRAIQKRDDAVN